MARSRETKIELTAYDDLFQTDESREEAKLSKIRDIPIAEIDEFPDHPFKVLMDEDMEQLVESIKRNGVMTPATVRLKEDGRYELISGHRRKKACELAGLETLKCEVKELTRDEAIIVMVESNLQDVDEVALSFAEVKMLATGDARFKEKMDLDIQVSKLRVLKQSYLSEHYDLEDRVLKYYPQTIKEYEERIAGYENDAALAEQHKPQSEAKFCPMTLKGVTYTEKADAGEMLLAICKDYPMSAPTEIGSYRGFRMEIYYDTVNAHYCMNLCGKAKHKVDLGADALGNLTRIENELSKLPVRLEAAKTKKAETIAQLETAKEEIKKPFAFEDELKEKTERLNALNIELNLNEKDTSVMDTEPEQAEEQPERKCASRER